MSPRTLIGYAPMEGTTLTHVAPVYLYGPEAKQYLRNATVLRPLCNKLMPRVTQVKDAVDETWKQELAEYQNATDVLRRDWPMGRLCARCKGWLEEAADIETHLALRML